MRASTIKIKIIFSIHFLSTVGADGEVKDEESVYEWQTPDTLPYGWPVPRVGEQVCINGKWGLVKDVRYHYREDGLASYIEVKCSGLLSPVNKCWNIFHT